MKTTVEKKEIAGKLTAKRLLELFISYHNDYNPLDSDTCETYEIIKAEMLKRMNQKGE